MIVPSRHRNQIGEVCGWPSGLTVVSQPIASVARRPRASAPASVGRIERLHPLSSSVQVDRTDLVEERQRARLALQGAADELAQRGLRLALDRRRQAERRDRLDVEPLVGLEQLERLERERAPFVRRAGAALAQDAAERRHPAEPLVGFQHPVAFDAAIDLGSLAELVEQVHLEPAGDAARVHSGVEQLVGPAQQRVDRLGRMPFLERPVGQLGQVPRGRGRLERVAEVQPGVSDARPG